MCPLCNSTKTNFYFTYNKNHQHTYHQCSRCDLVFVIPECRLSPDEEKSRYDMHNNNEQDQHYQQFLNRLATPMIDLLPTPSQGLDFGSGRTKTLAGLFEQANHQCHSYDIFYFPKQTLLEQQYDFISASEVVEHLYRPNEVLNQLWSSLKPNGLLGIMTNKCVSQTEFPQWWYKNDPTHVSLFSNKTFTFIAEKLGATIVHNQNSVVILQKNKALD